MEMPEVIALTILSILKIERFAITDEQFSFLVRYIKAVMSWGDK